MTKRVNAGLATAALLFGALACAGTGLPKDEVGAAPDTTEAQNPDTSGAAAQDTSGMGASDTTGTMGVDTTGQQ